MPEPLTRPKVKAYLDELVASLDSERCRTCECTQGYLVQLEMDATEDASSLIDPLKVSRDDMHPTGAHTVGTVSTYRMLPSAAFVIGRTGRASQPQLLPLSRRAHAVRGFTIANVRYSHEEGHYRPSGMLLPNV